jgi:hypothetical protein
MSPIKFSRIDIGSIQKKPKPERRKNIIKREVLPMELSYLRFKKTVAKVVEPKVEAVKEVLQPRRLYSNLKRMGSFAAIGLMLVLVFQGVLYLASARNASGEILGAATSAYSQLNSASANLGSQNFVQAKNLFESAQENIRKAQDRLDDYKALQWLTPQANSAHHILVGASFLSEAGQQLTGALNLFDELKVSSHGVETDGFNEKLSANREGLSQAYSLLLKSSDEFDQVGSIPTDYAGAFDAAKQQLDQLQALLKNLIGMEDLYLNLFDGDKTYLLVFENYDEIRATGGFIGTYGVLKTHAGGINDLKIESIYNLDGQIHAQIAAPGPFQPYIKKWGIRDANWFADFPTSASKLLEFFEKGQETADGVVAMTPKLFEDFLKLVGPIDMPEYGVTLTADNFQEVVQYKTSIDYDKRLNQPKKMLDDFAPKLLDRLSQLNKEQWIQAFQIIYDNLHSHQVVAYSKSEKVEKLIDDLGVSGKILGTDYDYLDIVNTNLGGTKTDLKIEQKVNLSGKILSDGSVMDTLQISRTSHAGEDNKDYLRVLVPNGSQLVSASGFDEYNYYKSASDGMQTDPDLATWDQGEIRSNVLVHKESGKAEFSGWVSTKPQQTSTVTLNYILPFKLNVDSFDQTQAYSLLLQKQVGSLPYQFSGIISLGLLRSKWSNQDVNSDGRTLSFKSNSNTDDFWAVLLSK